MNSGCIEFIGLRCKKCGHVFLEVLRPGKIVCPNCGIKDELVIEPEESGDDIV